MELNKTAYAVLGMLKLGRRTGYEIKSLVDVSTRFFWAASYGQIYPELGRLEAQGLVEGEREPGGGRRRKSYELTRDGEAALREWLTSDAPLHFELRHEGVLKVFFSDSLEPAEQAAQLARMRAAHETVLEQLRQVRAAKRPSDEGKVMPLEVLEWGIEYQEFVVGWCSRLERKLAGPIPSGRS